MNYSNNFCTTMIAHYLKFKSDIRYVTDPSFKQFTDNRIKHYKAIKNSLFPVQFFLN